MRKATTVALASAFAVVLVAALHTARANQRSIVVPKVASGDGTILFAGHDGKPTEPGYFTFRVEQEVRTSGTITFAAESHEAYPEIVINVPNIEYASFGRDYVHFVGSGRLQFIPVFVTVTAFDGQVETPDRLSIVATSDSGEILFHADGEVAIGDLTVGQQR